MNRPSILQVGGTLYWVLQTRNPDTMVLKDADSDTTTHRSVAVRKNGASTADSVTITKRAATTGIYDCSYNPASEVEGDAFTLEESATVTGTTTASATYTASWTARVVAVERGTDGANTAAPATPTNVSDVQTAVLAKLPAALVSGRMDSSVGAMTAGAVAAIWDALTSGMTTAGSIGKKLADWVVGTIDTYTGNTKQTGDGYAILSHVTYGNAALKTILDVIAQDTTTDIPALIASTIASLQVNTRAMMSVPIEIELPDSGTAVEKVYLALHDVDGNMEAPDSTPTIALTNSSGTDRSSRLSAATNLSTGFYSWDYTKTVGDTEEQLSWVFTVVEGGKTRVYPATSYIVEESAYRFSSSDRSTLNLAATAAALAAVQSDTNDIQTRIPAALSSGGSMMADIRSVDDVASVTGLSLLGQYLSMVTVGLDNFLAFAYRLTGTGLASQTSVDDLPTNAELATSQAAADDATLAAIAAESLKTADIQGRLPAALVGGRMPAELDSATQAQIAAIKVVTDRTGTMQVVDGAVYQYTANALELAPAGGGGGGGLTVGQAAQLTDIQEHTALITSTTRITIAADSGSDIELKIGDDYDASIDTAKRIEITDTGSLIHDLLTDVTLVEVTFGFGVGSKRDLVTGTIDPLTITHTAAVGAVPAYTTVFVECTVADTLAALVGQYDVPITHANGKKQTAFSGDCTLVNDWKS